MEYVFLVFEVFFLSKRRLKNPGVYIIAMHTAMTEPLQGVKLTPTTKSDFFCNNAFKKGYTSSLSRLTGMIFTIIAEMSQ